MKLRYFFSAILSSVLLLTGCVQEPLGSLEDIKLSSTNVSIPQDGGEAQVTLTATTDWAFVETKDWPSSSSWLTLKSGSTSGSAGVYELVFAAEGLQGGREISLEIKAGNHSQYLVVRQGNKVVEEATCKDVIDGPDGKTYRVKGVCTSIGNTTYGNWYLDDGTGQIYIYGTLDKDGGTKNFESWGMEQGDIVTVEGPKTTYNGTVELVDVTVLSIEKAFVKIITEEQTIEKEGGQFDVAIAYKGEGVSLSVPEAIRSWTSVVVLEDRPGVPTKMEPNPADTAVVKVSVLPNTEGDRSGSISFTSGTSTVDYNFFQKGSIIETTADEINAAADGETQYRLTGVVSSIANAKYGNIYISDYTGQVYCYGTYDAEGNRFDAFQTPVNLYDIVTVVGPKTSYNDSPQMKNVTVENHIPVTSATVADFLAAEEAGDVYYSITGTVANIVMDKEDPTQQNVYGNFDIVDETGSVYVYGLLSGWGGPSKQFRDLGLVEGDVITLVGVRSGYKGTPQVGSAFFVSKAE